MGVSERARSRCRERVEAIADAGLGADEARLAAIEELGRAVGFHRWCWPLVDPASVLSTTGIGVFDFTPSLPRLAALEQRGDVTSKPRLFAGRQASVALSAATGGRLDRSPRWRECLQPYGIGDELMTACRDPHGAWASVELMRDSDDPAFAEEDVRLLHDLAPVLGRLVRQSLRHGWQTAADGGPVLPPATVILGADLEPLSWTSTFHDWLAALPAVPGTLPTAIYELGTRALAPPEPGSNRVRIRTLPGRWAVLEGALLEGAQEGGVAITIRAATASEIFDLLARTCALTPRERQLAALVLEGLGTKQLAQALSVSPYTVQDHLKAIFAKTQTRTRGELVASLTGGA
jgi:DNA-binding CsgD family transcriptional regulator